MRIIVGDVAEGSATFQVVNILSTTQATVLWVDAPGDLVNPATLTVANGATVAPTGAPAVAVNGHNAFTILTADLTIPANTNTVVTVTVADATWVAEGQYLVIGDAIDGVGTFLVVALSDSTHFQATWVNALGDAAPGQILHVFGSAKVSPSGAPAGASVRFVLTDLANTYTSGGAGVETDLMAYTLPQGSLTHNGDALLIEAMFTILNNGNTKNVKLYFGGTQIFATGAAAQNVAGSVLVIRARVIRVAGSSQLAFTASNLTTGGTMSAVVTTTAQPAANLAINQQIKATGTSNVGTANDIVQFALIVRKDAV
jgi:hypothetical protein